MNKNEYNDYMECLELHAKHNLLQDITQFLYDNKGALKYFIFPQYKLMNKR